MKPLHEPAPGERRVIVPVDLSFSETGGGEPLVILHGLFGSKRNWSAIARRLGEHHRVISVDLRNHGESPWHERHDYPSLAADVAKLVETVIGGPANVLGHSMGGKAAMVLALTRPALVKKMVVVDIAPVLSTGTPIEYVRAMRGLPLASLTRRSEVADGLAAVIPDATIRNFLSLNAAVGDAGLSWMVNLDAIERDFGAILDFPELPVGQSFAGPTLFLTGERSDYVRPEHREAIERLFTHATFELVAAAGHWVHADAAEAFLAAVNRFLGE